MLPGNAEDALRRYLQDVAPLSLERARATRFVFLLAQLFPALDDLAQAYSAGTEKTVRILDAGTLRRGHVDTYYRDVIFEFEASLDRTGTHALEQLRDYAAAIWNEDRHRGRVVLVATDGLKWWRFHPRVQSGREAPVEAADIELGEAVERFDLGPARLEEFFFFLDRLLLREYAVPPTSDRIEQDFGLNSLAFHDVLADLRRVFALVREEPEVQVAYGQWRHYLSLVYGEDTADEELFLRHTYLSIFARFLVWASVMRRRGGARDLGAELPRILDGRAFEEIGFQNLHEGGFFTWIDRENAARALRRGWLRLLSQLATFDLERIDEDVLRGVYQELIDPKTRHDLGEFYTPDWLAKRIVDEVLEQSRRGARIPRVLDPACGSGTFLRVSLLELRKRLVSKPPREQLETLTSHVFGFDVHPLAVQIARATYALALGDLIKHQTRPIELPVYLADSLFLPRPIAQLDMLAGGRTVKIPFATKEVELPAAVLEEPAVFNPLIAHADALSVEMAAGRRTSPADFRASLRHELGSVAARSDFGEICSGLYEVAEKLADLRRERRDSIWAFVLRNMYRPALLKGCFDIVGGNPPWLSYRYVTEPEYQEQVGALADRFKLATRGKLRTQLELAAVFLLFSTETYLKEGGRLGFVMPRSLFNAGQHDAIRRGTYAAPCRIDTVWDLRGVEPLFNVPACVVFVTREDSLGKKTPKELPCRTLSGRLPAKNASSKEADAALEMVDERIFLKTLGEHSSWDRGREGRGANVLASSYHDRFRQGATLMPRNFYFVRPAHEELADDAIIYVKTDAEQAKEAKPPYRDEVLEGRVEARFLYHAVIAKHILPFVLRDPSWAVLPIEAADSGYRLLDATTLRARGFRHMARWVEDAGARWSRHRGAKAEKQSVLERLNYQHELTAQSPHARHLVLYNASGTHLAAVYVAPRRPLVVDEKCYWYAARDAAEGHYLAGVLNADVVDETIKPFQSVGQKGERDIHKKPLSLPIPSFDRSVSLHCEIAELSKGLAKRAKTLAPEIGRAIGKDRARVREGLTVERKTLDALVRRLLGL